MNTNINEEQVLKILENFLKKRKWKIDMKKDIKSDKKEIVEYWLDQNGIPQMF